MSDPFTKSFSQIDCKRLGCCAVFLCFIILLGSPKPHLSTLSLIGDDLKMLMVDDGTRGNNRTIAICTSSNYCEIEGDIRVDPKSSVVVVVAPPDSISNSTYSSIVEPYPRPNSGRVKKWQVKILYPTSGAPACTQRHPYPAILFSNTGFTGNKTVPGNYFHEFADLLFPLYTTSSEFQREVQFLITDHKPTWVRKYTLILNKLTKYKILNIDGEASHAQIHCYRKMIISLKYHDVFLTYPSLSNSSMPNFRLLLRETFSLKRAVAVAVGAKPTSPPPRLMIIDRKHNRVITNLAEVAGVARGLGFDVVVADSERSTSLARFVEGVNSCDVLVGVHGAGLTNMLFLPDEAVVIQVVPFGDVDWYAANDFGDPAPGMKLKYLKYKITAGESSLSRVYPSDHRVIRDPISYRGQDDFWKIFVRRQNVTLDLGGFKDTLVKALELLRR